MKSNCWQVNLLVPLAIALPQRNGNTEAEVREKQERADTESDTHQLSSAPDSFILPKVNFSFPGDL